MFDSFRQRFAPAEKRFLFCVVLLHLLVTTLPYLWAWTTTPAGFEYSGLLYNPDDQNVHLSWARQAADGNFFTRDLFTTESLQSGERALFFNAFTALIGVLSRLGLPLVFVYHLLRVVSAAALLLLFYALASRFSDDRRVRITTLLLAAFSSGAAFLAPLFPNRIWMDSPQNQGFPMMPEAFTFHSSFIFPLNVAAMALLVLTYLATLVAHESEESNTRRSALIVGFLAALFLSNIHTYDAIPLMLTLVLWTAFSRSTLSAIARWKNTAIILFGALLPVLYQFIVFRGSEEFRVKALTPTPAPPLLDVLLSYGFLIPLAIAGGVLAWRSATEKQRSVLRLAILWALVTLVCIYAPVSFARKMIEGLHLPLCVLAALGVVALASRLTSPVLRRAAIAGVLLLCSVSSLQFVAWALENARDNNASRAGVLMPPLYLSAGDSAALRFLKSQPRGKVVLCLPFLGNYVPRESGQSTYIGHWAETLHMERKLGEVLAFYQGSMDTTAQRQWLKQNRIDYVVFGTYEKQLGAPQTLESGRIVFNENGTTIYAVP